LDVHHLKLQTALNLYKVQVWPYEGAIAIKDGDSMVVVDKWCYLGIASDHDELYSLAGAGKAEFDLDIYKIVKKAIAGSHKQQVFQLTNTFETTR
jgi:DNA polymerase-3 subunit epsilon